MLGQIGATIVSLVFALFVGYLLYLKEQRDRTGNRIIELKRSMNSLAEQLKESLIPGVVHSLLARPKKGEKWDNLSICSWVAGVSWDMRVQAEKLDTHNIWNGVRKSLEDLVRGILPDGYFPEISPVSESFREWANAFIRNTEHIEWFYHEHNGHSWVSGLIGRMIEWEEKYPNPVLKSRDLALLLERIMKLRRLIKEDSLWEQNYQRLKVQNAVGHYKIIITGFLTMGFFSIFIPLLMLLLPPFDGEYTVSVISFSCFILFSLLTIYMLVKTAWK